MLRLRVKEAATAKGVSQGKLARYADLDVKTIQRIYRDPYAEISTFTLNKLAYALNVHVCELLDYERDASLPGMLQSPEKL
jgi:DNA-binding Xre family transcriptional regulator